LKNEDEKMKAKMRLNNDFNNNRNNVESKVLEIKMIINPIIKIYFYSKTNIKVIFVKKNLK
jgi:hypothetical protein